MDQLLALFLRSSSIDLWPPHPVRWPGMAIAEWINRDLGVTIVVWSGSVTQQDTHDQLMRLAANRYWPPGRRALTDMRTVTDVELPDPAVLAALFEDTDLPYVDKKAVVVTSEFLRRVRLEDAAKDYGMETVPFTELGGACEYLCIDTVAIQRTLEDLQAAIDAATFRMP